MNPATRKIAPATQIGTDVFKLAYNAMIGAYTTESVVGQARTHITHHDTEYTIRTRNDGISGPSVPRRKQLGRHRVQDAIHHVTREAVSTIPSKQFVRRACRRRRKNEHASEDLE
jgi:hypothetical protein